MTEPKFHEGQDVEVHLADWKQPDGCPSLTHPLGRWRAAKIDHYDGFGRYVVKFPDGTISYFLEENIRAVSVEERFAKEADFGVYD